MFPKILRLLNSIAVLPVAFAWFSSSLLDAQATSSLVTTRITQAIDENSRVTLLGAQHPLANKTNDRGAAPDSMQLERLTLFFKRSDTQESALRKLVSDLHTPGSASYHKWLTPEQFGSQFGPSDQDVATVQSWLSTHGFSVTRVNAGRQSMEFSGNVAQFRDTFHAQIHRYAVNGETHYANADAPQIPAALATVIGGFASLNNFRPRSFGRKLGTAIYDPKIDKATPQWTVGGAQGGDDFVLSPQDYAVQYDLNPLYQAGTNGTNQTIAIVNESNINLSLVQQFRTLFHVLPTTNLPQVIIDGNDPGIDGVNNPGGTNGAAEEAYLDVEWSGAIAPNAQIDLVIAADTALQSGLNLALQHAIYGNVAPVVSISFGACETALGSTNLFLNALYEQGAAQGQTILVSTGDSGSAGCDNNSTQDYAVDGQTVSGWASTPYNVAVGGTDFYYSSWNQGSTAINNQLMTYWKSDSSGFVTSNSSPAVSLLGYIPEQPWNGSQYGSNINTGLGTIDAGSGGASNAAVCSSSYDPATGACTGTLSGYPKPSWQSGTGVPPDGVRDIPDVSLFASNSINRSEYPICSADGDCQPVSSGSTAQITEFSGTSASTPAFAGIMALVNQKYGPQGQANFVLYPLAAQFPAAFHDVTNGTNSVPCNITATSGTTSGGSASVVPPSRNCIAVSNPITVTDGFYGTATEGQIGTGTTPEYNAGVGYDLASGLGSVDANVLVTDWNKVTFASSNVTLTPSQTSFAHGTTININGAVTGTSPTGDVALMTDSTEPTEQSQTKFALNSGSYSGSTTRLPGGTYNIWGQYGGDSKNAASTSSKTLIAVSPENSGIVFNLLSPGGTTIAAGTGNIDYGTQILLNAVVAPSSQLAAKGNCLTGASACPVYESPTGTVTFADGPSTFNTAVINAEGFAEYNYPVAVGSHSVTASYSGDNSYNKSTAPAVTFTVVKDTPVIGFGASNQVSQTQFNSGQPTVLNLEILNGAAFNDPGINPSPVAAPTGTVTVSGLPGGTMTATLSPGTDPTFQGPVGLATVTVPSTNTTGNYTANVSYSGDGNYNTSSMSFPMQFASLGGLSTTTTATMSGSFSPSTTITITGTVTGQSGNPAPTGGVLIFSSGYPVKTIPLNVPTSGDVSTFSVTFNSRTLFQGANFVTVQYLGDQTYNVSAIALNNGNAISNPVSDFSMVPQAGLVPVSVGSQGTETINVSSTNSFAGAVNFTCAATTVTCSVTQSTTLAAGGTGAIILTIDAGSSVPAGDYNVSITGTDSTGRFIHTLAIQAAVSFKPAFALGSGGGITVTAGQSGTSTITVTPSGGFTGSVALACVFSSPSYGVGCSLSPATVNVTGGAVNSTLTVNAVSSNRALERPLNRLFGAGGGAMLALVLFFGIPARRRSWRTLAGVLVFAAVAGLGGCSSSSSNNNAGGKNNGVSANYTVTVTGTSGSVSTQITMVNVTVAQ